jgi:hypothetical protein
MKKVPTPKDKKQSVDLTVPLNPSQFTSDECFGNAWEPSDKDCSICADIEICGILYQDKIKKKEATIKAKQKSHFIDVGDFAKVPEVKVIKICKRYFDDGEPLTLEELMELVIEYAEISDHTAVLNYIKRLLAGNNFKIDNNKNIIPDEPINNNGQYKLKDN